MEIYSFLSANNKTTTTDDPAHSIELLRALTLMRGLPEETTERVQFKFLIEMILVRFYCHSEIFCRSLGQHAQAVGRHQD